MPEAVWLLLSIDHPRFPSGRGGGERRKGAGEECALTACSSNTACLGNVAHQEHIFGSEPLFGMKQCG
jgi:hypothetical protein